MNNDEIQQMLAENNAVYTLFVTEDGGLQIDAENYDESNKPVWGSLWGTSIGIFANLTVQGKVGINASGINTLDNGVVIQTDVNATQGVAIQVNNGIKAGIYAIEVANDIDSVSMGIWLKGALNTGMAGIQMQSINTNSMMMGPNPSIHVSGDIINSGGSGINVNGNIQAEMNAIYVSGSITSQNGNGIQTTGPVQCMSDNCIPVSITDMYCS